MIFKGPSEVSTLDSYFLDCTVHTEHCSDSTYEFKIMPKSFMMFMHAKILQLKIEALQKVLVPYLLTANDKYSIGEWLLHCNMIQVKKVKGPACRLSLKMERGDEQKPLMHCINIDFRSSEMPPLPNNGIFKSMLDVLQIPWIVSSLVLPFDINSWTIYKNYTINSNSRYIYQYWRAT